MWAGLGTGSDAHDRFRILQPRREAYFVAKVACRLFDDVFT